MKIIEIDISNFRGIQKGHIMFYDHTALFGSNNTGKSTIIDALLLACSKTPIHKNLNEYDFYGGNPKPSDRFKIVVTLGGFIKNDPDMNLDWFREGRAVTKWWNTENKSVSLQRKDRNDLLCCQIGFAGRFDYTDLDVETIRYFHDDDMQEDPFDEDKVVVFPSRLLENIGLFVLPTLRLKESVISFNSYIFKYLINQTANMPSDYILQQRDRFRNPENPIEGIEGMKELVQRIDDSLGELFPLSPELKFRFTQTDADSVLNIISPHYSNNSNVLLPAKRYGSGLLSIQYLLLLLELGKTKKKNNESFILLMEEPEIHISQNIQNQLIFKSFKNSDQVISSTHSSYIASFFQYTNIMILSNSKGALISRPFREKSLTNVATQVQRKIFIDNRELYLKSLLFPNIIIPEGKTDFEWITKFIAIGESCEAYNIKQSEKSSFGTLFGIVPTHCANILPTYEEIFNFNNNIIFFVDGDSQGDSYIEQIKSTVDRIVTIIQWEKPFSIEDIVAYILDAGGEDVVLRLQELLGSDIKDMNAFCEVFKQKVKDNYLMHSDIASIMRENEKCVIRIIKLLEDLTIIISQIISGTYTDYDERSDEKCKIKVWSTK